MKIILKIVGIISAFFLSLFGLSGCDNQESAVTLYGVNDPILLKNRQIEQYCGESVKGSEVKMLIKIVNTMNEQDYFPKDLMIKDSLEANITLSGDEYVYDNLQSSNYYKLLPKYGEDGYITEIYIENSNKE